MCHLYPGRTVGHPPFSNCGTHYNRLEITLVNWHSVCIASIIRLTALYKLPNPDLNCKYISTYLYSTLPDVPGADTWTVNFPVSLLWGTIQSGLAIICSCLPILGPVFGAVAKASDAVRTWYGSLRSRSSKSKTSHGGGSKASNAAGSGQSWTRFEDSRYIGAAGSWARVDHEDGSENFRLKPMHSGTASSDRDLEQQQYSFLH